MKDFLKTFTAVVLGTALVLFTGFFILIGSVTSMVRMGMGRTAGIVPDRAVLYISFESGLAIQDSGLPSFGFLPTDLNIARGGTGFLGIVHAIEQAAQDPAVRMIYLNPSDLNARMTHIEEIRNALITFRQSGKPVLSYADTYSQQAYYLATAADRIILNPAGSIILQGFSININYYRELFDKLGLEAQVIRNGSYKSGGEPFTSSRMSDPERLQLQAYISAVWDHWSEGMDLMRHLEKGTVDNLCSRTFITEAARAKETGLADEIWHQDEVIAYLSSVYDNIPERKLPIVAVQDYIKYTELNKRKPVRDKIAVVYAAGNIVAGKGRGQVFASDFAAQIRQYRNDSTVRAVVIRVESPGGDPLAADIITREIQLTAGIKPVVASLGDVAASGGYWIASAANKIFVNPSTMTGSIGVYSISFNGEKTMSDVLGVKNETVDTHPFSHFSSLYHRKSEQELDIIRDQIESTYTRFLDVVSENRHMDRSETESLADGRIWSGKDAHQNGLADEKGGLADAIREAARMAGISDYRLTAYPRPLRVTDLIGLKDRNLNTGIEQVIQTRILDLAGPRGIQARLPFHEQAISW
ncbi:MAG: signal peptide peptidase SppA [Bacteroidales bacterium]|jgi:protease-4|nr:signal peptide peptidase SppA [Bacteroidales bacterium]MDD3639887.1 signal peptide peptidase SppA [Bacteroidales bacterium]MDD3944148.1 signal peptide peptidase SppA [Bacteroidales bacterium]MDY0359619.1 signal peptide peptidase SppA [Bacteroidales bacterium]NLN37226.1 signal peptide peptidase SppA [Bacteroidales bacterium]